VGVHITIGKKKYEIILNPGLESVITAGGVTGKVFAVHCD